MNQKRIDKAFAEAGPQGFAAAFLRARGLDWAADLLGRWPGAAGNDAQPVSPVRSNLAQPEMMT